MKTLKVLAGVFLGLILFLSLAVFGLTLTARTTALSAGFITSRLNDLPVSPLVHEIEPRAVADNPEVAGYIEGFVTQHEPEVKERLGNAIGDVYDYLLGRAPDLKLADTLEATILDPQLTTKLIGGLDKAFLAEHFSDNILALIGNWPSDFPVKEYLGDVAVELGPWINEQAGVVVPPAYDYVLGKSQHLNVVISLEPVKESLRTVLEQAFLESPPPELAGLPPAVLEQEFDTRFEQFARSIPATFTLNESFLGLDKIRPDVAQALGDAEQALGEARGYIGYFQLGFGLSIGFILLLIAGIILVYRQIRAGTRVLGIVFLAYGTLELVGVFIVRSLARAQIMSADIPASVQEWLVRLAGGSLTPLLIFVIALLLVGAALVAVSFAYRSRRQPE